MKRTTTILLGAGMLALAACGSSETETNGVDTANVQADDLTLPADDALEPLPADGLGNEGDLGLGNAGDLNTVDANAAGDANLSADSNLTNGL